LVNHILPLADGSRSVAELEAAAADVGLDADSLREGLALLAKQGFVCEGALPADGRASTWNFVQEATQSAAQIQRVLCGSVVAVYGANAMAQAAADSLASFGVGGLRVVDGLELRASVDVQVTRSSPPREFDEWQTWLRGAHFALCCPDPGMTRPLFQMNRACHALSVKWAVASSNGFESAIGPTIVPGHTACYVCYRMRSVACAEMPEDEFAVLRADDDRTEPLSGVENTLISAGTAGHMVAMEAIRQLSGAFGPGLAGVMVVIDHVLPSMSRHKVIKHPGCPVCGAQR
jgi:adenylyltransferase/sulfurtransferase